jgi:hypothetical protein
MSTKAFVIAPRKPASAALSEEAARKLEEAIAAKGEGVAGSAALAPPEPPPPEPVVLQARELISSATDDQPPAGEENAKVSEERVARVRGTVKSRARRVPTTGVGTMHNPRVRKTDGVQTRSTTVHLPVDLAKKLAVHCAVAGRKQSEVIAEAVEALLA